MTAKILLPTPENLAVAAQAIQQGDVVGMPTETVYGLAGNSRSVRALARIFETKERPTFDPLIIHVGIPVGHVGPVENGIHELEKLRLIDASGLTELQRTQVDRLIQSFWPGPLTLVLPKHPDVPDLATSGLSTVGIRMPSHPIAQALIAASQCPLAAPSANRFGRISPTTPQAVKDELGDRIQWILDGGPSQIGLESTVLAFNEQGNLCVLRPGGTSLEKIEELLGESLSETPSQSLQGPPSPLLATPAPGMLESHYAPKKPFYLLNQRVPLLDSIDFAFISKAMSSFSLSSKIGLLLMSGDPEPLSQQLSQAINRPVLSRSLSRTGDLHEVAYRLFAEMRWLDSSDAAVLFAEPCTPNQGLSHAIADRLNRASARSRTQ